MKDLQVVIVALNLLSHHFPAFLQEHRIVSVLGSETIVISSQQYTQKGGKGKADVFANAIKHDHKSKNPTTRWSDIIKLK